MAVQLLMILNGRGWKSGEIAEVRAGDYQFPPTKSKKEWDEQEYWLVLGVHKNDFPDDFVVLTVTDKDPTDRELYGISTAPALLNSSGNELRRYRLDLSTNKQPAKDLKKDGYASCVWDDIKDEIIDGRFE